MGCPQEGGSHIWEQGEPAYQGWAQDPGEKQSVDLQGLDLFFFFTWLVKGALCGCRECARLSASPAIIQSTSAPFDRDAKAGKILSSYRSSENRSLEDLGDFRGH